MIFLTIYNMLTASLSRPLEQVERLLQCGIYVIYSTS
jgi:hypothetical protein